LNANDFYHLIITIEGKMTWSNEWQQPMPSPVAAKPSNPLDALNQDQLLMRWQDCKNTLAAAKEAEIELRKYIVSRAFPNPNEGMNTLELGEGYQLKAAVKFNYNLEDNKKVEDGLNRIEQIGNQGKFIADRLVSWQPTFLLTEYRVLQTEAKEGSQEAKQILAIVNDFLIITEVAPALDIKQPKGKKK
jgi:hypothetical protein